MQDCICGQGPSKGHHKLDLISPKSDCTQNYNNLFGALILEHVSEIMADTYNVSAHQKNK